MVTTGTGSAKTVKLAERRVFSQSFKPLYNEGMGLVEEAAEYLDGPGRAAAKGLSKTSAGLYAAESMRLTTRLMQLASWLLLQRAANAGEMTREQVAAEKAKVRLDTASTGAMRRAGKACRKSFAILSSVRCAWKRWFVAWMRKFTVLTRRTVKTRL